jgi:hypothetical protein
VIARSVLERRLRALGAATFPHVNGTLERHLHGTERLLCQWGNREAVCVAGLYHAVYGTDGIEGRLVGPEAREAIAAVIGSEAEALAYLYGACDRERFHRRIGSDIQTMFVDRFTGCERSISEATLRGFCEITVANELELALDNADFRRRHADALLELVRRMGGLISDRARDAAFDLLLPGKTQETR